VCVSGSECFDISDALATHLYSRFTKSLDRLLVSTDAISHRSTGSNHAGGLEHQCAPSLVRFGTHLTGAEIDSTILAFVFEIFVSYDEINHYKCHHNMQHNFFP